MVEAVSKFANGRYNDAADTLTRVSAEQRIGVGGSRVERMLVDLLEERAEDLAQA